MLVFAPCFKGQTWPLPLPLPSHRDWDVQGLCLGFIYKDLLVSKKCRKSAFFLKKITIKEKRHRRKREYVTRDSVTLE